MPRKEIASMSVWGERFTVAKSPNDGLYACVHEETGFAISNPFQTPEACLVAAATYLRVMGEQDFAKILAWRISQIGEDE